MKSATLLVLGLSLGLTMAAAAQQQPTTDMKIVAEKIRADKKLLVADNMGLTEADAVKFWPVYDAYQVDLGNIAKRTVMLIKNYADSYAAMTDPTADKLLTELLAIETDRLGLMKTYRPKFAAVVAAKMVTRYYQIENKIRAVVQYELADAIPLVP